MTKERVLERLWKQTGESVSGGELARSLGLSRTAVWKAVQQLRREGYIIEALPGSGYRLLAGGGALSELALRDHLRHRQLRLRVYPSIDSTNSTLKRLAESGEPEGLALLAEEQTAGRGRMDRRFYSPAGGGLYLSLLLRPGLGAADATALTACAAVAVAEAIEALTGRQTQIKWVNDVLVEGKKVCGILTEGAIDCETGRLLYAVVGIGINISPPPGGFPPELRGIAGALVDSGGEALRAPLAARVLDGLLDLYEALPERRCYAAYRERSCLLGREILIHNWNGPPVPATALDIGEDFSLIVRGEDGGIRALRAGEVSVRTTSGQTPAPG